MRISVSGDRVDVGPHLQEYLSRHLFYALGRFGTAIDHVDVRLADINGPRGGVDKRCRIVVKLRAADSTSLTVDDEDTNLRVAVANATARIGRAVARALDRKRGQLAYRRRRAVAEVDRLVEEEMASDV